MLARPFRAGPARAASLRRPSDARVDTRVGDVTGAATLSAALLASHQLVTSGISMPTARVRAGHGPRPEPATDLSAVSSAGIEPASCSLARFSATHSAQCRTSSASELRPVSSGATEPLRELEHAPLDQMRDRVQIDRRRVTPEAQRLERDCTAAGETVEHLGGRLGYACRDELSERLDPAGSAASLKSEHAAISAKIRSRSTRHQDPEQASRARSRDSWPAVGAPTTGADDAGGPAVAPLFSRCDASLIASNGSPSSISSRLTRSPPRC